MQMWPKVWTGVEEMELVEIVEVPLVPSPLWTSVQIESCVPILL